MDKKYPFSKTTKGMSQKRYLDFFLIQTGQLSRDFIAFILLADVHRRQVVPNQLATPKWLSVKQPASERLKHRAAIELFKQAGRPAAATSPLGAKARW
jgi:hypothetical protein